jgi:hypothetical protein
VSLATDDNEEEEEEEEEAFLLSSGASASLAPSPADFFFADATDDDDNNDDYDEEGEEAEEEGPKKKEVNQVEEIPARIKEWAYAGLTFNLIFAILSHVVVDGNIGYIVLPIVVMAILAVSYWYNPQLQKHS